MRRVEPQWGVHIFFKFCKFTENRGKNRTNIIFHQRDKKINTFLTSKTKIRGRGPYAWRIISVTMHLIFSLASDWLKAKFRRRTLHEPNRMQMRKILCIRFGSCEVRRLNLALNASRYRIFPRSENIPKFSKQRMLQKKNWRIINTIRQYPSSGAILWSNISPKTSQCSSSYALWRLFTSGNR